MRHSVARIVLASATAAGALLLAWAIHEDLTNGMSFSVGLKAGVGFAFVFVGALVNIHRAIVDPQPQPVPEKPKLARRFKGPVRWLFGRQLISGLKWIALYSIFEEKIDALDWMRPKVRPFKSESDEFWFDYIADSGDGQMAVYSIAYLCQTDLWTDGPVHVGSWLKFEPSTEDRTRLPRGRFLFVGGDTAYHIADYATLALRFQAPFEWAYEDLKWVGHAPDRRPLFGIPGNHDCYDLRDGFHRQFRQPLTSEGMPDLFGHFPQLSMSGFFRDQQASFVALQLPFDWWLWGVDCQEGRLDTRQAQFFRGCNGGERPRKLIVATPEPTTVFGAYEDPNSYRARAFRDRLNLPPAFLRGQTLPAGTCRLDISGDTHHYERYWGPSSQNGTAPSAPNYSSVVSGLGGAFLHPSQTDFGEIEPQCVYPARKESRVASVVRLLSPFHIFNGGLVWLVGGLLAVIMYLGSDAIRGSKVAMERFLTLLGVLPGEPSSVIADVAGFFFSIPSFVSGGRSPSPFGGSVLVMMTMALAGGILALSAWYSKQLVKQASVRPVTGFDYWPVWVWTSCAAAVVGFGVWRWGHVAASEFLFDLLYSVMFFGVLLGLPIYAVAVGCSRHSKRGKTIMAVVGLFHGLLQLSVPFTLVHAPRGPQLMTLGLFVAFTLAGIGVAATRFHWTLPVFWIAYGIFQLGVVAGALPAPLTYRWSFRGMVGAFIAGGIMTCVWFGWYLAVSLVFNAHNNEAGGASRIGRFKQLIRFRLTKADLTGYVIAIDDPEIDGRRLHPRIVDVFRIAP